MKIYRLHLGARMSADYTGATLAGGRWNSIGTPMLYTAEHLSLACVEVLVHLDKGQVPEGYVWSSAGLEGEPTTLRLVHLSEVSSCQAVGDVWIHAADSLAAKVPSVIVPQEFNILLNPKHPAYGNLHWSEPLPFRFDPRLFFSEPQMF
jgi:RES domain-containing protein